MNESIVVDVDPPDRRAGQTKAREVVMQLEDVPPKAVSRGWGDVPTETRG